jgi:hypothetical protein
MATRAEEALAAMVSAMMQEKGVPKELADAMALGGVIIGSETGKSVAAHQRTQRKNTKRTKKRALNEWQLYVSKNKNKHKYKSGSKKGQVNFKSLSRAFKKTKKGRKKK